MHPELLAYLDPGTGSVILQALVGGVAGVVVIVKMGGRKFLSFLPIIGKKYRDAPIATTDNVSQSDPDPEGSDAPEGEGDFDPSDLATLLEDAADS